MLVNYRLISKQNLKQGELKAQPGNGTANTAQLPTFKQTQLLIKEKIHQKEIEQRDIKYRFTAYDESTKTITLGLTWYQKVDEDIKQTVFNPDAMKERVEQGIKQFKNSSALISNSLGIHALLETNDGFIILTKKALHGNIAAIGGYVDCPENILETDTLEIDPFQDLVRELAEPEEGLLLQPEDYTPELIGIAEQEYHLGTNILFHVKVNKPSTAFQNKTAKEHLEIYLIKPDEVAEFLKKTNTQLWYHTAALLDILDITRF